MLGCLTLNIQHVMTWVVALHSREALLKAAASTKPKGIAPRSAPDSRRGDALEIKWISGKVMGELSFLDSTYDKDSTAKLLCEVVSSPSLVLFTKRPDPKAGENNGYFRPMTCPAC